VPPCRFKLYVRPLYHLQHLHRRSTSAQKPIFAISPHSSIRCHTPIYLEARLLQPYAFNPQHRIQRPSNDGLVRRKPTPSISSFLTPSTCLKHFAFHVIPGPRSVTCSYLRSMPLLSLSWICICRFEQEALSGLNESFPKLVCSVG
jgi:hypothetical protein